MSTTEKNEKEYLARVAFRNYEWEDSHYLKIKAENAEKALEKLKAQEKSSCCMNTQVFEIVNLDTLEIEAYEG